MSDVFISYARRERDRVEPFRARLAAAGLDCFFDVDGIDGGDLFPDAITRALDGASVILACWSPLYFTRPWCLIESREGLREQKLLPVMLAPFDRKAPPVDLRDVNYFDLANLTARDEHEGWNRVLRSVGDHLGRNLSLEHKRTSARRPQTDLPILDPRKTAKALAELRTRSPASEVLKEKMLEYFQVRFAKWQTGRIYPPLAEDGSIDLAKRDALLDAFEARVRE